MADLAPTATWSYLMTPCHNYLARLPKGHPIILALPLKDEAGSQQAVACGLDRPCNWPSPRLGSTPRHVHARGFS